MMTTPIFFFSGTGNTAWCAEQISQRLGQRGLQTELYSIEAIDRAGVDFCLEQAPIIGLGWPVYGSDLPEPMKRFIESLPDGGGRKVFTFCTQLLFSGNGAQVYARELRQRNWQIGWSAHFNMPNNICVTQVPFPYSADPADHGKRLQRASAKIDRFVVAIYEDRRFAQGASRFSAALGYLQRGPYRHYFPRLRNDISIDAEICTRCGRCVTICPVGNLTMADGLVIAAGHCVLCVRCYNFCPVQAVRYAGKPHNPKRGIPYRGPVAGFRPEQLIS